MRTQPRMVSHSSKGQLDGLHEARKHGKSKTPTFLRRHAAQACWTCLRLTGNPPRLGSDATNFTFRAWGGAKLAAGGADMMASHGWLLFLNV